MMQPVMKGAEERRLQIVEIGTGVGSEAAKKLHGFVFGKATEIAVWVCDGYNDIYSARIKMAGQLLDDYSRFYL